MIRFRPRVKRCPRRVTDYFDRAEVIRPPAITNARPTQSEVERNISGQSGCFCQARRTTTSKPAQTNGPPMKSVVPV